MILLGTIFIFFKNRLNIFFVLAARTQLHAVALVLLPAPALSLPQATASDQHAGRTDLVQHAASVGDGEEEMENGGEEPQDRHARAWEHIAIQVTDNICTLRTFLVHFAY